MAEVRFLRGLESNLPPYADDGTILVTTDTGKLFLGQGVGLPLIPLGGGANSIPSDILDEVEKIKETLITTVDVFEEDFQKADYIDTVKTTASFGRGWVRPSKMANFVEDFSTQNYFDEANSNNIVIDTDAMEAKLFPGALSGTGYSKPLPTSGTQYAMIQPNVGHESVPSFLQTTRLSDTDLTSHQYNAKTIYDRLGRKWTIIAIVGVGFRLKCWDTDGTLIVNTTYSTTSVFNSAHTMFGAAFDYDNKLWLSWAWGTTSSDRIGLTVNHYAAVFNPDGTVFLPAFVTFVSDSFGAIKGQFYWTYTDVTVDRNNRIWITAGLYKYTSDGNTHYAMNSYVCAYNSDGSVFLPKSTCGSSTSAGTAAAVAPWGVKVVYDPVNDTIILLQILGNGVYGQIRDLAGNVILNVKTIKADNNSSGKMDAFFDASLGKLVIAYIDKTGGMRLLRVDPVTLTMESDFLTGLSKISASTFNVIPRDGKYHLAYCSNFENQTNTSVHYAVLNPDGTVVLDMALQGTVNSSYQNLNPFLYFTPDGSVGVTYSATRTSSYYLVDDALLANHPTTVTFQLSNDGGVTWYDAEPGQIVTFDQIGNSLRVKFTMTTPQSGYTPKLFGYSIVEGNDDPDTGTVQEFVSKRIPSITLTPVTKYMLSVSVQENDGSVEWFVSNNGGATWLPATLGEVTDFPDKFGADVRVKAVLTYPAGGANPPTIFGYTLTKYNSKMADPTPVGAIAFFGHDSIPAGWLKCNGAAVSREAYVDLFAAIGTTYGEGDGETTFNLPDLRGEFVRGWDDGAHVDIGRELGSKQPATYLSFSTVNGEVAVSSNVRGIVNSDGEDVTMSSSLPAFATSGGNIPYKFHAVRPRNIALVACIKY